LVAGATFTVFAFDVGEKDGGVPSRPDLESLESFISSSLEGRLTSFVVTSLAARERRKGGSTDGSVPISFRLDETNAFDLLEVFDENILVVLNDIMFALNIMSTPHCDRSSDCSCSRPQQPRSAKFKTLEGLACWSDKMNAASLLRSTIKLELPLLNSFLATRTSPLTGGGRSRNDGLGKAV
jgi:hypothetical protein